MADTVNKKDDEGNTSLHHAVATGNVFIVQTLLDIGARVDEPGPDDLTPLMVAAKSNRLKTPMMLLDKNASVDKEDKDGNSALHWAAKFGRLKLCTLLLDKDSDVNKKNKKGDTALHVATHGGHPKIIDLLIKRKADKQKRNTEGKTAFEIAILENKVEVATSLADPQEESMAGTSRTPDDNACSSNSLQPREEGSASAASKNKSTEIFVSSGRFKKDFHTISELGNGVYGIVYKVTDKNTNVKYAVKRVNVKGCEKERNDILLEAEILKKLEHENIIKYEDAWMEENPLIKMVRDSKISDLESSLPTHFLYMQTELCEVETLKHRLAKGQPDTKTKKLQVMSQIVSALDYAHNLEVPVMHRDLKPENIFFSPANQVKIGDFGGATLVTLKQKGFTDEKVSINHKTFVGSKTYMSPEQLRVYSYGRKAEIFTLGLIFYEILSPFSDNDVDRDNAFQVLRCQKIPSQKFKENHPEEFELISKMLKEESGDHPSASEVRENVNKLLVYELQKSL